MPSAARTGRSHRRHGLGPTLGWLLGKVLTIVVAAVLIAVAWALAYRWVDPPITVPMIRDAIAGQHVERTWVGLDRINPAMARAVIGAEDSTFCSHHGFDVAAIEQAAARNATSTRLRGGSTISQQTAKNAFLWPGRSYLRKGLEAYFTVLIEALWGKRRIMEVYLNLAELGPGVYGVEAAAHRYFDTTAAALTPAQAARIAAILPQPIQRDAADLHGKVRRHARAIEKRIGVVRRDAIDGCLTPDPLDPPRSRGGGAPYARRRGGRAISYSLSATAPPARG